jgi:predicted nuclease with TOPRIM domain
MKFCKIAFILLVIILFSSLVFGQTNVKTKPTTIITPASNQIKSSPAYAEIVLRKTELLSELESLLVEYTEDYPKVKEMRYETGLLQKEMDKILTLNAADSAKLTTALGKLIVRKCELETDLWSLQKQFNDEHPDVKRAKRKVEIFDAAIKDIFQGK